MIERQRKVLLSAAVAAFVASSLPAIAGPAFPGAEGFGANAIGGRDGDVYHVTSLADTLTPGTLRYGLRESGFPAAGRTIVFDVGGVINLTASLDIKNISRVTIAGQTAPTPISIVNNTIQITGSNNRNTDDIVMRYLNVRKGTGNGEDAISIKGSPSTSSITFTTNNIILDHVSGSWSEDEVISVTQRASNVTVQYSMMSEALTNDHAYGSLVRPMVDSNVTYHHNLYTNQKSRNPRPGTYNEKKLNFEFNNNVVYNWSDRAGYAGGSSEGDTEFVDMNYIGNYLIAGPSTLGDNKRTTAFTRDIGASPIVVHVHQSGNLIDSNAGPARDGVNTDWAMFATSDGTAWPSNTVDDQDLRRATPYSFSGMATDSAQVAYERVIASVGAFPYARHSIDQRLVGNVLNYTGTAPITAPDTTEWNNLLATPTVTRPAGFDTDLDGMPNAWEIARALNPGFDDHKLVASNGWTNLENYLNELTFIANWNLNADANWSTILAWAGERPNSILATANFVSGITAPRTVTVDAPVTVGQLTFDGTQSYTLAGANSISMDVVSGTSAIAVSGGQHNIAAPLVLNDNTQITVGAGAVLNVSGPVTATNVAIGKSGAGVLILSNIRATSLSISDGTVATTAAASQVNALTLSGPAATLDLADNDLIVGAGTDRATIEAQIAFARNGGAWDRAGITTSAATGNTTLGVLSGAEYTSVGGDGTFDGLNYTATDTLVKYTYYGDSDFNGLVNFDDYARIDSGFNNNLGGWLNGDFDGSGSVNFDDYALIDLAFNTQGGSLSAVPEPGVSSLVSIAVLFGCRRQRRVI